MAMDIHPDPIEEPKGVRLSHEIHDEIKQQIEGDEYNIYGDDSEDLYFLGRIRGKDANDAINNLLKTRELELDVNLFAIKFTNLEGPFVIRLNPSAVLASEMVQVA
jgi:hypothetical protein